MAKDTSNGNRGSVNNVDEPEQKGSTDAGTNADGQGSQDDTPTPPASTNAAHAHHRHPPRAIRPSGTGAPGDQQRRGDKADLPKRNLVPAGPCPLSPNHKNAVVYSTTGRVRYCKCNDCGHTWKQTGPFAEPWKECMMSLAETLAQVERQDAGDGVRVVVLRADEVDEICRELSRHVEAG